MNVWTINKFIESEHLPFAFIFQFFFLFLIPRNALPSKNKKPSKIIQSIPKYKRAHIHTTPLHFNITKSNVCIKISGNKKERHMNASQSKKKKTNIKEA